jgi:hypothetical protein
MLKPISLFTPKNLKHWAKGYLIAEPGNANLRGRLSTVDLLALTSSYQLLLVLKTSYPIDIKRQKLISKGLLCARY